MENSIKKEIIPASSIILDEEFGKPDYADAYRIKITAGFSIDYLTAKFFTSFPLWIKLLMGVRYVIVKPFGLKTGSGGIATLPDLSARYSEGDTVAIFHLLKRNKNEIVLAENDRHLNFRTSVYTVNEPDSYYLYSCTVVKYNNIWGKLYFGIVRPFHKLMIKSMLHNFKI